MTTSTPLTSSSASEATPASAPLTGTDTGLRLSLRDARGPRGPVEGAWWPRSRDLQTEAADLVDHFPDTAGRVGRMLVSTPDWDSVPRKVVVGRGPVKVGSFPSDDTHLMVLSMGDRSRVRLVVVPHDTDPEAAATVLHDVRLDGNLRGAHELLGTTPRRRSGTVGRHADAAGS